MRVLVDEAVNAEFPGLDRAVADLRPDWNLEAFDARLGNANIGDALTRNRPDVLVIDSKWLIIGAPILMNLLRNATVNAAKTLITVPHVDNVTKIRAAHNGFTDTIRSDESTTTLLEKIEKIKNGESDLDNDQLWSIVRKPTPTHTENPIAESETDRAIVELLRIGIPDNEIADALNLSGQTLRNRVSAMLQRDGFMNRTQLAWAYTNQVLVERSSENPLWRTS